MTGPHLSPYVGQELPPTRTYEFSGQLKGTWPRLSLSEANAKLTRENFAMDLAGGVDDLAAVSGIKVDVSARGADLSSVPELARFESPETDHFEFEGRLSGSASRLSITSLQAALEQGDHRLTVSGDVGEMPGYGDMDLEHHRRQKRVRQLERPVDQ